MDNKKMKSTDKITYEGKVRVSVLKGKKTLSTKTYKNNGRWPLFSCIASCIAGDTSAIASNRPKFVSVYSVGDEGGAAPTDSFSSLISRGVPRLSMSKVMYASDPILSISDTTPEAVEGEASISFKFLIPYSQLDLSVSSQGVNMFVLYNKADADASNAMAYVILVDKGTGLLDTAVPAATRDKSSFSLLIQWTMTITN